MTNQISPERADIIFNEFVDTINKIEKHSELKPYYNRCVKQLQKEIEMTTPKKEKTTYKKVIISPDKYEEYLKSPHKDDEGNSYYLDDYNEPLYTTSKNELYYIDKSGKNIYVDEDENGETYYVDENNEPIELIKDSNNKLYHVDESGNKIYLFNYEDTSPLGTPSKEIIPYKYTYKAPEIKEVKELMNKDPNLKKEFRRIFSDMLMSGEIGKDEYNELFKGDLKHLDKEKLEQKLLTHPELSNALFEDAKKQYVRGDIDIKEYEKIKALSEKPIKPITTTGVYFNDPINYKKQNKIILK